MGMLELMQTKDLERFRKCMFESRLFFLNREDPAFYEKILNESELKGNLLNGALRASECRVVKEDTPIDPYSYTEGPRKSLYMTQDGDRLVDTKKVLSLYSDGCSISLMSLERRYPKLARLRNQLIHELSASVHLNLYASPKGGRGLAVHEDYHDVIILQLSGSKHWEIFDRDTNFPLSDSPSLPNDFKRKSKVDEFVLQKGDMAFIPRGIAHRAYAEGESSIHLTIGIDWYTYRDLFSEFLKTAAEKEIDLRRPVFALQNQTDMTSYVDKLRSLLELEHCHESMHEAIERLEKNLRNSVLDEQIDSLKSMDLSIEKFCETSLIRVNHSRFTSLVSSDDGILLKYPGNEIQLHSGFMDLVLAIIGRGNNTFTLQSILKRPLSPEEEKFIRFLVKDGFLVAIG